MKRPWLALVAVAVLGSLAGVAIAGRPTTVDDTVITPAPSTVAPATTTSTQPTAPSTSTPVSFEADAVRVVVANASDLPGVAAEIQDFLLAAGFANTTAVNAINPLAVTVIFTRSGFEDAATAIAEELGLDASTVHPLPTRKVTARDADADVIVAIGDDFPI